jgi:hypothetical protein
MSMEPEDGCLRVLDLDDDVSIVVFTARGIEYLKELLDDLIRSDPDCGSSFCEPP